MSAAEDPLVSFIFYIAVVAPVTSFFLKPNKKFSRSTGLLLAVGFLASIAAIKSGYEIYQRDSNYYSLLDVGRGSTPLEIKKAYKKMSLELHPDKNKSPTAGDEFARLKDAYDVLMDMELRDVYNKFGPDGIKQNKRYDEYHVLLEIGVFYITWAILAFVLTLGKSNSNARSWLYTGQIVMLVAEVSLMLSQESKLPPWFLPKTTEFEIIALLHSLFPAYLNGCRILGSFLYVDVEEQTRKAMRDLMEQNKLILLNIQQIYASLNQLQGRGLRAAGDGGAVARVGGGGGAGAGVGVGGGMTPAEKRKEITEKLMRGPEASRKVETLQTPQKSGNYGFIWMILMYIVFHYVFSGSSSS